MSLQTMSIMVYSPTPRGKAKDMFQPSQTIVFVDDGQVERPSLYDRSTRAWVCGRCGAGTVRAWTGTRCSGCGAEVARVERRQTAFSVAGERLGRGLDFWLPRIFGALLVGGLVFGAASMLVAATWLERALLALGGMAVAFALSATVRTLSLLLLALVLAIGLLLVVARLALWGWALVL
jgi:hypothetical protein